VGGIDRGVHHHPDHRRDGQAGRPSPARPAARSPRPPPPAPRRSCPPPAARCHRHIHRPPQRLIGQLPVLQPVATTRPPARPPARGDAAGSCANRKIISAKSSASRVASLSRSAFQASATPTACTGPSSSRNATPGGLSRAIPAETTRHAQPRRHEAQLRHRAPHLPHDARREARGAAGRDHRIRIGRLIPRGRISSDSSASCDSGSGKLLPASGCPDGSAAANTSRPSGLASPDAGRVPAAAARDPPRPAAAPPPHPWCRAPARHRRIGRASCSARTSGGR
jgi:hypothetical protein